MVPTRVGMNRARNVCHKAFLGGPHTRGDEPHPDVRAIQFYLWSPHAWG